MDIEKCRRFLVERERVQHEANNALKQHFLQKIKSLEQVLIKYPAIEKAYLFGSITQENRFNEDSDIDIGVEGDVGTVYFDVWRDLEEQLRANVDLRTLSNNKVSRIIKQEGRCIYERAG